MNILTGRNLFDIQILSRLRIGTQVFASLYSDVIVQNRFDISI